MFVEGPTQISAVDAIVGELLRGVKNVLGPAFVGMYLEGSLASGDFDDDSDVDFVVATLRKVSDQLFADLREMHERIATVDSRWAFVLEGSYLPLDALRRNDPANIVHPNLEWGRGEHLKWAVHDETWDIHRYIVRERGINVEGPDPKGLIDPVSADDLRRAALAMLHGWAEGLLEDPSVIVSRGYQAYIVLTMCRILYTLQFGDVVSKPKATRWARQTVPDRWIALIDRAWVARHVHTGLLPDPGEIAETLDFVRYTLNGR